MSYEGIVSINKEILKGVLGRRDLKTDFKSDVAMSENLKDIHHLIRSNQYIITEVYVRIG